LTRTSTVAVTAVGPAIWGTTYYATTKWLPSGYPILDGAVRALPAGLALLALRWQLPSGVWWWRIGVLGMLNIGLFFPLLFVAAERVPGGIAGAVGAIQPLIVLMMSTVILRSRITATALAAGVGGVVGVTLLVVRASGHVDMVGVLAAVVGTAEMGLAIVLAKRWGRPPMSPVTLTGWMLTAGGLFLTPLALATEGLPQHLSGTNWFGLVCLAVIGGAVSYFLWMRGVGALPASAMSFLTLVVPLVAATIGWLALGQSLTPLQLLGMAVALASLVVGQRVVARPAGRPIPAAGQWRHGSTAAGLVDRRPSPAAGSRPARRADHPGRRAGRAIQPLVRTRRAIGQHD